MSISIEKARKQAFFAAIGAIIIGAVVIVAAIVIYALYGSWLDSFSGQQGNATTNAFLVKAVKAASFRLVPALSVALIAVGEALSFI